MPHGLPHGRQGMQKVLHEVGHGILKGGKAVHERADEFVQKEPEDANIPLQGGSNSKADSRPGMKTRLHNIQQDILQLPDKVRNDPLAFVGLDYTKETRKDKQKYLKLDGYGTLSLSSPDPMPSGCHALAVYCTSPYTGSRQAKPEVSSTGWSAQLAVPDRVVDVSLQFLDRRGGIVLMAGFQLPSISASNQELVLPLVSITQPEKHHSKNIAMTVQGRMKVVYSITYNTATEYRNLWRYPIFPKLYVEPPTAWDDVVLQMNALGARAVLLVENADVVTMMQHAYDILFWTSPTYTAFLYTSVILAIAFVGYFHLAGPALWLGSIGIVIAGKWKTQRWAELARVQADSRPRQYLQKNPEVAKLLVSTMWCIWWVIDMAMTIITWQYTRFTVVVLCLLLMSGLITFIVPGWLLLNVLVTLVFVVPGAVMKYPVLAAYVWPPHLFGMFLRKTVAKPYVGRLSLTVHNAHGLRISDLRKNDPYVAVMVAEQHRHTRPIMNALRPVWNEEVQFIVFSPNCQVQLWMWDYDIASGDDFMGEAFFQTPATYGGKGGEQYRWLDVRMRPCMPLDFHLFVGGRVRISWSLEDITPSL